MGLRRYDCISLCRGLTAELQSGFCLNVFPFAKSFGFRSALRSKRIWRQYIFRSLYCMQPHAAVGTHFM